MSDWASSTLVFVRDVDLSIRFYVDALEFTLNMRHEDNGAALVAGVSRGAGCALLLTSQWPDRIGTGILYTALDSRDVEALCADLQAKGVATKEGWWGGKILVVADPDGNQLYVARPEGEEN